MADQHCLADPGCLLAETPRGSSRLQAENGEALSLLGFNLPTSLIDDEETVKSSCADKCVLVERLGLHTVGGDPTPWDVAQSWEQSMCKLVSALCNVDLFCTSGSFRK